MTHTLPGADIRGYYTALGMDLPSWARTEASVRCFADPDAHNRGDRDPSCSVNLEHGAWHCHGCAAKGGAFDGYDLTDFVLKLGSTRSAELVTGAREQSNAPRAPLRYRDVQSR